MKQLTCEMCGSTDLVKQDGVFACQSCGCKYSVEEARKMMVEGTVNVKGTVIVDRSSEVDNILKNADITYEDGNYSEAFDLYSKAMNIDPDNPHAILYRAISSAWQSTVKNCRITEINKASKRAFELQHKLYGDSKDYFDFCYDATCKIAPLINAISDMYINYYNEAKPVNYSITGAIATAGISAEVKNTLHTGITNCCVVNTNIITYIISDVEDYSEACDGLWRVLHNMAHNCIVYRNNANMGYDSTTNAFEAFVDELPKKAKKDAYWKAHQDEKLALDKEKAELEVEIVQLTETLEDLPECTAVVELEAKIAELEKEKEQLGYSLFKGKEKKAVQMKVDKLKEELVKAKDAENRVAQPFRDKLDKLTERLDEIDGILANVD